MYVVRKGSDSPPPTPGAPTSPAGCRPATPSGPGSSPGSPAAAGHSPPAGRPNGLAADIGAKEDIYRIAGAAAALVGPLDVVVQNASTLGPTPLRLLLDTGCEDFTRVLDVNLVGPFRRTKAVAGGMGVRARIGAGHHPGVVDGLLTGLHQQGETHFELLRAFAPDDALEGALRHAAAEGYLSHEFGDAMVVI